MNPLPDLDHIPAPDWLPIPPEPEPSLSLDDMDAASSMGALLSTMKENGTKIKVLRSVLVEAPNDRKAEPRERDGETPPDGKHRHPQIGGLGEPSLAPDEAPDRPPLA